MVVEAAETVMWTKPDDLAYDPMKPVPALGANPAAANFLVLMMDGATRLPAPTISTRTWWLACHPSDGNVLPDDWGN